jgi:tight adherence protein C
MAAISAVIAFVLIMLVVSYVGYRRYARPARIMEQLSSPSVAIALGPPEVRESSLVRILKQLGSKVPSSGDTAGLRKDLFMAGYRSEHAVPVFFGLRVAGALVMTGASLLMQDLFQEHYALRMMLLGMGALVGFRLPLFFLQKKIARRKETLRLSLPDALDLMVVSVEAGLGLDQAMQHVARELQIAHPALCEELSLVGLEMRAGKRRAEALRNLAGRTGEPEIRKLVAILVQNDRFGTSMAESLRTHSDFMRVRRRQEAEERAGKVGVKLVFPIFFFILPSMMVVAAGPGLLQVFKYLFPMMKQIN